MADGQRVRWWQEEDGQAQAAQNAVERVAVAPAPLLPETVTTSTSVVTAEQERSESQNGTWAELEAEALRRAVRSETGETQPISSFLNKPVLLSDKGRRTRFFRSLYLFQAFVFLGLAGLLTYTGLFLHKPDFFHFVMCLVFGIYALWRARSWQKS